MPRGSLRIILGAAPGVGTTYAMLHEGARRRSRGTDVVVGIVDTRDRPATAAALRELEVVRPKVVLADGAHVVTIDVDAVLQRAPGIVLVDDLGATATRDGTVPARWQQVEQLLAAGLDVVATMEISDVQSLRDPIERITGIRPPAAVPDAWLVDAEQIELVDMTPEALARRLAHGNLYPPEQVDAVLARSFRPDTLGALRELALLWVADRVDDQLRRRTGSGGVGEAWETRERVVVAVTGAPGAAVVVRRAARMAGRLGGDLIGVHVASAGGRRTVRRDELEEHRRLLESLGGTYREVIADDVADALVAVARAERATQIVVGASRRTRREELTGGSVLNRLLRRARGFDVHVISAPVDDAAASPTHSFTWGRRPWSPGRVRWVWLSASMGLVLLVGAIVVEREVLGVPTPLVVLSSMVGALVAGLAASTLANRLARATADTARAAQHHEVLTRTTRALATAADPIPLLLEEVRAVTGADGATVLTRHGDDWTPVAASGDDPPGAPADGVVVALRSDDEVLVVRASAVQADDAALLDVIAREIAVALAAAELQRDAAAGQALAEAEAVRVGILQAVSHDLRTPLAGIKASVTSLLASDVHFDARDTEGFLTTIDAEVDRLDRVVGNLLDMSRLQSGSLPVQARPTALEEVVAAALAGLGGVAAGRTEVRVSEELPLVLVDASLLERAVANVVANAVAATPADAPAVVIDAAKVGDRVNLRVVDQGPGISRSQRDTVFEPFQRLGDRSTQAGVGLGLAIARGFTRSMGGELTLEDTPGGGLTAVFELPLAAVSQGSEEVT